MICTERILLLLKTRGVLPIQRLADELGVTSMGARKQLQALADKGLVTVSVRSTGVGRPTQFWSLTERGHQGFPDHHADLTLQLIDQVRVIFGESGLEKLIDQRGKQIERDYSTVLIEQPDLEAKVYRLAALRIEEGYMAEVIKQAEGDWLLYEHHCPICAAAQQCQHFCRSELALFTALLGPDAEVSRTEHLLHGGKRCCYQIIKKNDNKSDIHQ